MRRIDCFSLGDPLVTGLCQIHRPDGSRETTAVTLQRQHSMSVIIDGVLAYTLVCTPEHISELVVGRLFCDQVIASVNDVASLHVCRQGDVVKVELVRPAALQPSPTQVSTCNAAREAHAATVRDEALPPLEPQPFERSWVFSLAEVFSRDTPMHRRTRGAHSCFLARGDQVLFCCEDVGRHNAFDKAVGWALLRGIDLGRCLAITSGRVPTDMAVKAIRAGIPVLLSASVPTEQALHLAQRKNLALIGRIGKEGVTVFCDPTGSMDRAATDRCPAAASPRSRKLA